MVYKRFVCVLVLHPLGKMWALGSECKIDQADSTEWCSFQPSNLMDEIICNPEAHRSMK